MLNLGLRAASQARRRIFYPIISVVVALSIFLGQPLVSQALPWAEIILQGVQVIQLANLSDRQEVALGNQINQEVLRQVRLNRDRQLNAYINDIGQRLVKTSTRRQIPYTFQVVQSDQVNAFATMGGFVYVNTGLIKAADNEAQLASVMAHEIGHIVGRHAVNQMKEQATVGLGAAAAGLNRNQAVALGVELALRRPHSRKAEYEADSLGLRMLANSGYAPSAMPAFMKKLVSASQPPTFLSTHPATTDRIARMNEMIPAARRDVGEGLDSSEYRRLTSSVR
ncbi:MAG TPA: M48 family metalloprotease [Leptolyngbyaceae cyanobacterium M33_DOE_097]|uniref:M48 family peptidase n=1 Tax=Oscillatoriales cyanobacterium SpSt-418 TaxID=2282169 RepID=A0A7C3KFQ3_9CYAN|nr:M48 family metalloprotease [Leptolyngbyaceae cyanobacterium M33_DOE_097]